MFSQERIRSLAENLTTMRSLFTLLCFVIFSKALFGQSIHEEQLNFYNASGSTNASDYESFETDLISRPKKNCTLDKVVYGWHPYWVGNAYQNYQWNLLSHFSFFSYEVNASDGQPLTTHGWSTSAAVDAALASGNTKVTLCVTLFSGHTTFFGSPTAQQTLITNLINLVQSRGAHGVNIDFEGIPSSQTTNFANFMVNLANQMHTAIPGSEVSTVLYAVDWNNVFDFSIMEPAVDQYIIMGYGYYYGGSSTAGPTDPLYHFGTNYNYTLSRSITYYLNEGCPANKLVMGLPSYGYEWQTTGLTIPSSTTGGGTARTYAYVKNNSSGNYSAGNHIWEQDSYTDVYAFNNGANNQCMISLDSAWRKRLDHIRKTGIAGIGIWALGYDNGYTQLWDAMETYLTDCYDDPCSGTIHDFGGPTKNYYNWEDYTWTIAPPNATSIDVDFSMFNIEANWDYLYVYDGPDTQSPQIAGSPFTGTVGPGQFTTSSGSVTFRFTSDVSTVAPGFLATYTCSTLPLPEPAYMSGLTTICEGDSIMLVNTSNYEDSVEWTSISGAISSNIGDTVYLYPVTSGNYVVGIEAFNNTGNALWTDTLTIMIDTAPIAGMNVNSTNLSLPNAIAYFTNNSTNAQSYYWFFGDGGSSTDASPWHEYTATGVYDGYLAATNGVCEGDTVFFQITVGTGSLEDVLSAQFTVYPNPFQDKIIISSDIKSYTIELYDAQGRQIPTEVNFISDKCEIVTRVSEGIYFLHIITEDNSELVYPIKKG